MKTSAPPRGTTASVPKPKPAPGATDAPMMSMSPPTPSPAMGGAMRGRTPSVSQPAGARFRAPEAPTMAPRGTPETAGRRKDKTP